MNFYNLNFTMVDMGIITLIIILMQLIKKCVKKEPKRPTFNIFSIKDLFPIFTLALGLIFANGVAFLTCSKVEKEYLDFIFLKTFTYFLGSIAFYDVLIEKIIKYMRYKKERR